MRFMSKLVLFAVVFTIGVGAYKVSHNFRRSSRDAVRLGARASESPELAEPPERPEPPASRT